MNQHYLLFSRFLNDFNFFGRGIQTLKKKNMLLNKKNNFRGGQFCSCEGSEGKRWVIGMLGS